MIQGAAAVEKMTEEIKTRYARLFRVWACPAKTIFAVIPGWSEGPDPESRDSGFDAAHRPGM